LWRLSWLKITLGQTTQTFSTSVSSIITTGHRQNISATDRISSSNKIVYGNIELDSHADSIVAGSNCCVLQITGRECDVTPFRDDYDSIKNVQIVQAATAWQSPNSGQVYILIFNEALWMGDSMKHSLINPNHLRFLGP